jgi:hypothetical protein
MTFIHGYLLTGLLLVGVPVLIHLIMRQKPRVLQFPAFRFLKQKHLTNQRKIRLQHLLLLLLRMLVIAALCLALARPRFFTQRAAEGTERPIAAVLVFDTSPSMEYAVNGLSRLDEARQRARELLQEMADGSRVAVLDTGEDAGDAESGDWIANPALFAARIDGLRIRPANAPLNRQIDRAVRLLKTVEEGEDAPPRFLYVFSDRTRGCWDAADARRSTPPADAVINVVFVDVGVDNPQDLAIEKVEVMPPAVAPGDRMQVHVTVRATGRDFDTALTCQFDNDADIDRLPVVLGKGRSQTYVFNRDAPTQLQGADESPHHVTVQLAGNDAVPFNNTRFATFLVRQPGKVLALAEKPEEARLWKAALNASRRFRCEVRTAEEGASLDVTAFRAYNVVCLFEVKEPKAALWDNLRDYVRGGGGLVIVPAGYTKAEDIERFNNDAKSRGLLPAVLGAYTSVPENAPGVHWAAFSERHPITAYFHKASRSENPDFAQPEAFPRVFAYWPAELVDDKSFVIAAYADGKSPPAPALVERAVERGKVVLLTTTLDGTRHKMLGDRAWNNYWTDSLFGLYLANEICRYLTGEATKPELNYWCGQPPQVTLHGPPPPPYTLSGPGLIAAESNLGSLDSSNRLTITQTLTPGNFSVRDGKGQTVATFSINVRPEENQLDRVPIEEIEAALGKDTVLPVGRTVSLREALAGRRAPPVELLPWLMMALLLALTVEGLLANRFYRRRSSGATIPEPERVST